MKLKLDQRGFSLVQVLILGSIVSILSGAGISIINLMNRANQNSQIGSQATFLQMQVRQLLELPKTCECLVKDIKFPMGALGSNSELDFRTIELFNESSNSCNPTGLVVLDPKSPPAGFENAQLKIKDFTSAGPNQVLASITWTLEKQAGLYIGSKYSTGAVPLKLSVEVAGGMVTVKRCIVPGQEEKVAGTLFSSPVLALAGNGNVVIDVKSHPKLDPHATQLLIKAVSQSEHNLDPGKVYFKLPGVTDFQMIAHGMVSSSESGKDMNLIWLPVNEAGKIRFKITNQQIGSNPQHISRVQILGQK